MNIFKSGKEIRLENALCKLMVNGWKTHSNEKEGDKTRKKHYLS